MTLIKLENMRHKLLHGYLLINGLLLAADAQTPSGGPYTISQTVIASGGGNSNSNGAGFIVEGTTGQSTVGASSAGGQYRITGGFWQNTLAPTAASVSVGGHVVTAAGLPIDRVRITLTDQSGGLRIALTNPFGYFRFDEIEVGHIYLLTAESKRYEFVPRAVTVNDEISDLELVALP